MLVENCGTSINDVFPCGFVLLYFRRTDISVRLSGFLRPSTDDEGYVVKLEWVLMD